MEKQRPLIGVIAAEAEYIFFSRSLECIQKELFAADMDAAVFSSLMMSGNPEFDAAENSVYDLINLDLLDGIIIFPTSINDEAARNKLTERIRNEFRGPVVSFDCEVEGFEHALYNYQPAVDTVIAHLAEKHGVKTADFVGGPDDAFHNTVMQYFVQSMKKHGISIPDERIHRGQDWIADFSAIADDIIAHGLPDAVVCCSDLTAVQMLSALAEKGVKVPDDVILTGFSQKEPYGADYINITSAQRDPAVMAHNATSYIISKIKGTEHAPLSDERPAELRTGMTCGCDRLNLSTLCREAATQMTVMQRHGVESYYNFMLEDMIAAETFYDYLWKVNWYTHFLGDFTGFWMCFNNKVMHNAVPEPGFTDKINLSFQRVGSKGTVDLMNKFPRDIMLPAIFEKRNTPASFIFTSLHFMGVNYGYVAVSYGNSGRIYNKEYVKWLRSVTCALEKQRRHILYNDAVTESQVRDSLTGLLNMRGYTRIMTERCGRFNDPSKLLRIISIDVENMKGINDTYGYAEGDRVLSALGVALSSAAGDSDIVVRVSGDEFFIAGILDKDSVDDVPNRLQSTMNNLNSHDSEFGVNIYTASVSAPITDRSILERLPYDAAYQRTMAKDNHTKMHKTAEVTTESFDPQERLNVIRLLNENLFTYNFQPIVDAHTGCIFAYEALMRSGEEFRLSPLTILTHAEALDRLQDVERCTMFNTMRFAMENQHLLGDRLLFVNSIPACTLPDPDFEKLHHLYGSIMNKIVVEFTEQTEASSGQLKTLLERSQRCGFQIAIDDYGTGYSNISNLLTFMPNVVKIDRSLIMNIHKDKRKKHFTKNIIDYAHDNNFMALAEGVELYEELQTVIGMGVDLIQGYYTAKPSADLIMEIDPDIVQEIQNCNRLTENRRPKKTYFTGDEREISLMALDLDNYTDIIVNKPDYTLTGNRNYVSEMVIRIKDNSDCRLDLVDISLKNDTTGAAITVGQNSTMTLNIIGEVNITGGIYVPSGSTLKITGSGSLTVRSAETQTYAIGSGSTMPYGNIEIDMSGGVYIHLDSEKSVAIGGRSNDGGSHIRVCCKELDIKQMGKHTLGIGSLLSPADIAIEGTRMNIEHHSRTALGIGSFSDPCNISISSGNMDFTMSGDKVGGIGSFNSCGGRICMKSVRITTEFKAKEILGIGADKQFGTITMNDCTFNSLIEGAESVAIGSADCEGTLSMHNCSGDITVHSGTKTLLGVTPENLIMENSGLNFKD
ncbi:MAG: EAL domain-containing protein [Oscillospiraceae bacterium]|nr:EAL domain-containing protein [Oscillospiraceae bacterium]